MIDPDEAFRLAWADYFIARAAKSRANGDSHPQHRTVWYDKAMTEEECAIVLRMTSQSLPELLAALKQ